METGSCSHGGSVSGGVLGGPLNVTPTRNGLHGEHGAAGPAAQTQTRPAGTGPGAAAEVRPAGGWSGGENQLGCELHNKRISNQIHPDCL